MIRYDLNDIYDLLTIIYWLSFKLELNVLNLESVKCMDKILNFDADIAPV